MSQRKTTNQHDSEKRRQVRRRKSSQVSESDEVSGAVFRGGTPESQVNTLAQLPRPQQQTAIRNIGKIQGNRRAAQVVATLQRHPGHDSLNSEQEQVVDGMAANLQRQVSPVIMRAEQLQDENQQAIINPFEVGNVPLLSAPRGGAASRGNLVARDQLTVLRRDPSFVYVHVTSGALAGQHGYVSLSKIIMAAAATPTSLRTPTTGTENAYTQLQTELAKPAPSQYQIFIIVLQRMTAAQRQRLLRPGNVEWEKLAALDVISADHLFNLLSLMGTRLQRKLTEYTDWGGKNVARLRLAFATSANDERVEVARDDKLVGELHKILGRTHPEIIFGHVLEDVYPLDGKIKTLRSTHPNLARWLGRFVSGRTDLTQAVSDRGRLLVGALTEISTQSARRAKRAVMRAVYRAPRGMALSGTERDALDEIAVHAYNQTIYSSSNMATMFLTRFGQPLVGGSRYPKTFIYRLWQTLKKLPDDNVILNNVLTSFNLNKDPKAAGSFTDWLGSKDFGMIRSNLPVAAESLHVDGNQHSSSIRVREPYVDLFKPNDGVMIGGRAGNVNVRVRWVNPRSRRLGVSKRVNVNNGDLIVPISTQASVTTNTLRADGAQHSRSIRVQEPHVELFRNGIVKVHETNNKQVTEARVRWVNPRSRRLGLSKRVNISNGANITLTGKSPVVKVVHAAATQHSDRIRIVEPYAELFRGEVVDIVETNGTLTKATVNNASSGKILELSQRVKVRRGATIIPSNTLATWEKGAALRIQTNTRLIADEGGIPSQFDAHGPLQAGVMVAKLGERTLGETRYFKVRVLKGGPRHQVGWVLAASVTGMGMSAREAVFEWTLRHEMGHALDLQINGLSQFSAPSVAQWRKYTGVADWVADLIRTAGIANPDTNRVLGGKNNNFRAAAQTYSEAVQNEKSGNAQAMAAREWLNSWVAAGGNRDVYNTITQFDADPWYFSRNNLGLPVLGGRIFGAHYREWFSSAGAARTQSLAAGVSPYAYTCSYEFFADHYASYTGPGNGGQPYIRAVPGWAQDFFDRLVGRSGAGPRVGMKRHRMDRG
jgi:hypothetical protein